jgi:hypothetical protein
VSGFETNVTSRTVDQQAATWPTGDITPSRVDIDAYVARAHRLRSEHAGALVRQLLLTLASLWRRPGRLTPSPTNKAASA